ncbi:hypothetical protein SI65_07394 [Aspergillus cristatus]|uniref:DUF1917 domain-containing protein n=1 Tax=Aspergillus cristatus TaxID=573508 RepID=A0A1E3B7P2_ASPCR|nr:hypothetical protein SI65_07394 [Aspergillus cristatus]
MATTIQDTDLFSDESSFYGDDTQITHYEDLADSYDPEPYWVETHPHLLTTIQHDALVSAQPSPPSKTTAALKEEECLPPIGSRRLPRNARGRNEPVPEFLARLPPSTTKEESIGPWIFVSEPDRRKGVDQEEEEDLASFVAKGTELLREFEEKKSKLEEEHDRSGAKSKAPLTRKLNVHRRALEEDIFALARENGVISGKWMLFPSVGRVDAVWKAVVEATVDGELGDGAKVATDAGDRRARGMMIYTKDYEDIEDVRRVLGKLVELELVNTEQRMGIYYKADAFTYLRILGDNPYGLKASLYSSKDVLAGKV